RRVGRGSSRASPATGIRANPGAACADRRRYGPADMDSPERPSGRIDRVDPGAWTTPGRTSVQLRRDHTEDGRADRRHLDPPPIHRKGVRGGAHDIDLLGSPTYGG